MRNLIATYVSSFISIIVSMTVSIVILLFSQGNAVALTDADEAWLTALTNAESEIAAIETHDGPFSAKLFDPLMSLARLNIEQGQVEEAENALRRAQNINHRNAGVYSPDQLESVGLLTELAIQGEEFEAANQLQEFAFFVSTHHIGIDNPDTLYAYADLARWYLRTGQPRRARILLEEAIELADKHGRESLQFALLITRARRLYGVYHNADDLLEALQSSGADKDLRTNTLLTLADSYILNRKPDLAVEYYGKAFDISPVMVSNRPLPITVKRQIHQPQSSTIQIYKVQTHPFSKRRTLELLSLNEQLDDQSRPPQWFILDADRKHLTFKTPDRNESALTEGGTQKLTGSPLKFSLEQLNNILPRSRRSAAARENLRIELTFTVQSTGNLQDITVTESNAPPALKRLLVSVLKRVYFRPRLDRGRPVDTEGVVLVQTFLPEPGTLE